MNVALFASAFHPHFGGVEELCRQLAHAYVRKGHQVTIITNRWPRDLPAEEEFEGLAVRRFAFRVPEPGDLKAQVNYRLTHRSVLRSLLALLRKRGVELLHVQCISSNAHYALLAKEALGLPLVVTAQGELTMDAAGLYQRPTFMNRRLGTVLAGADYLTGCSRRTLDDVLGHVGMAEPSGRAGVVFNGVSVADFDRGEPHPHPHPYILGIGRVVPQKGFDVLIKAFAHSGVRDHDLLIAGDGPERAGLEGLARDCGLTDRVRFVGRADRPKAVSLFRGASFVALPSRADEGLPVVTVETMAAGKALVACRVGGVPESVMDGETGIIVPRDDVEAFAAGLRDLAGDPARRAAYGEAARQRAQLFDWDVIADRYVEVYQAVRGGGGRTATAASGRGRAAVAVGAPS